MCQTGLCNYESSYTGDCMYYMYYQECDEDIILPCLKIEMEGEV